MTRERQTESSRRTSNAERNSERHDELFPSGCSSSRPYPGVGPTHFIPRKQRLGKLPGRLAPKDSFEQGSSSGWILDHLTLRRLSFCACASRFGPMIFRARADSIWTSTLRLAGR